MTRQNPDSPQPPASEPPEPPAAPSSPPSSPSPSDLDREAEEVTVAVMAASRLVVAISARALASTADVLTLPQLRALVVLSTCGPVKLATMASTLGVNPSTALRMAERLESLDLVDRKTNPDNRREVVLRLTPAGQDMVDRVLTHRRTEVRALVERLPDETRAVLVPALKALTEAADVLAADYFDEVRRVGALIEDPLNPAPPTTPHSARSARGSRG
ncbi:MarR family winged helix-turn-helix transcriptional regulator [Streptomyces sp. NPDC008313]|uniref:MarR family winged helix-turn-helix transcriptional regulator n=1 Tax=Streptomyces sp. NPDC008313 TaxID=3364826 RepID=UPI0036F10D8C